MHAIHAAITEIWCLYAVGTCLITARLFVRIKLVGFRGLQPDDILVVFAWVSGHEPRVINNSPGPFPDERD